MSLMDASVADSPPGDDYTTPLKKRRLARESLSSEVNPVATNLDSMETPSEVCIFLTLVTLHHQ